MNDKALVSRSVEAHKRKFTEQKKLIEELGAQYLRNPNIITLDDIACSISICCINIMAIYESGYKHFFHTYFDKLCEEQHEEINSNKKKKFAREFLFAENNEDLEQKTFFRLLRNSQTFNFPEICTTLIELQKYNNESIKLVNLIANDSKHSHLTIAKLQKFEEVFFTKNKFEVKEHPFKFDFSIDIDPETKTIINYDIPHNEMQRHFGGKVLVSGFGRNQNYGLAAVMVDVPEGKYYKIVDFYLHALEMNQVVDPSGKNIREPFFEDRFQMYFYKRDMQFLLLKVNGFLYNPFDLLQRSFDFSVKKYHTFMKHCY